MSERKQFNPIECAREIENSYREYIATTIHFDDSNLQKQLVDILGHPGYLAKGPFLEAVPPYHKGKTVAQLVEGGVLCKDMLGLGGGDTDAFDPNRPLYAHQVSAIEKAAQGRNYAVVTGTGSGKTECFLLPILNDILTEFEAEGLSSGVRAMILYPMNALANDQLKRLRSLLKGTQITFGRYTGDTEEQQRKALAKWKEENPNQQKLENEIISREEIRRNPPNILLTNYSMLEYLLLRPSDAPLFGSALGSKWRHITIDEAHVYSGTLGTEISYLLRRLKARIECESGVPLKLHCYATSATIGSDKDMPKVAKFASDLFGEPFSDDPDDLDVITSSKDTPARDLDKTPWGSLTLDTWKKLRQILYVEEPSRSALREALAEGGAPSEVLGRLDGLDLPAGLGAVLLGELSTMKLVKRCASLLDLTDISEIDGIGIDGLSGNDEGIELLTSMVEVLSHAKRPNGTPVLSSRYHSFLRAPEGLFINLSEMRLTPHKTTSERYRDTDDTVPVYEVSVCRHCGQAYILGSEESDQGTSLHWLNPRHEGTDADDEFVPRKYYRILKSIDERDKDEEAMWLCPTCGTLHIDRDGGGHRFEHEPIERIPVALNESDEKQSDERIARCRHCGYQSAVAIQPMRVSPEAAGSVVCYDLVRNVPPFESNDESADSRPHPMHRQEETAKGGSVICFSDKRQDAAFFAPAMERTYASITRRQAIYEAIRAAGDEGCSFRGIVNWLSRTGAMRYGRLFTTKQKTDRRTEAEAWLLDELAAEDSRNSLEGLGAIRIEPTDFLEYLESDCWNAAIEASLDKLDAECFDWLSPERFRTLVRLSLELMRSSNITSGGGGTQDYRKNFEKLSNVLVRSRDAAGSIKHFKVFVGSESGPEGRFRTIARKFAHSCGAELSKEAATDLLDELFTFINWRLGEMDLLADDREWSEDILALSQDLWTFYPSHPNDTVYLCDTCGCMTHVDSGGVCLTAKCDGTARKMTLRQTKEKDSYYKEIYRNRALPIRIEEHTAQLSSKKAREIQSDFIHGKVNVLSCTTTFELGVDVGDLRAIFMRNVPPTAANYAQRAGRVGRRAGLPGYAVTFARLRPHDIAFFGDPEQIIAGDSPVPSVYRDNEAIAIRHIFAAALSSFFRYGLDENCLDCSREYNDFLDLSESRPEGLRHLESYLSSHPQELLQQIEQILPHSLSTSKDIDPASWAWTEKLLGEGAGSDPDEEGRLLRVHDLKHADFERLEEGIENNRGSDDFLASKLVRSQGMLREANTIQVLAEGGVLPKYGFPTDLVELNLPELYSASSDARLSLQRGMRQAIREYAPGAEIVAGGELWKSVGIRQPRGHQLMIRRYGICEKCETFVWPIDNFSEEMTCPACGTTIQLKKKMLVPSYGFEGKKQKKGIGLRRPRSVGYTNVYFSQMWKGEIKENSIPLAGGTLNVKYASNGQLCILNEPRKGFHVCSYCHAAAPTAKDIQHWSWCDKGSSRTIEHYHALGSSFTTDVLELSFSCASLAGKAPEAWESLMWALLAASSQILGIPETELGGTYYRGKSTGMAIMLYDNVPGGAGHALQLQDKIEPILKKALEIVSTCTCSEDTCCYGCIANYYNQARQAVLSRGAAKQMLEALLHPSTALPGSPCDAVLSHENDSQEVEQDSPLQVLFDSVSLEDCTFSEACLYALNECAYEGERRFIQGLSTMGTDLELERPMMDVTCVFTTGEEAGALLAWEQARLLVLNASNKREFIDAVGADFRDIAGWSIYVAGEDRPEAIIDALKESKELE